MRTRILLSLVAVSALSLTSLVSLEPQSDGSSALSLEARADALRCCRRFARAMASFGRAVKEAAKTVAAGAVKAAESVGQAVHSAADHVAQTFSKEELSRLGKKLKGAWASARDSIVSAYEKAKASAAKLVTAALKASFVKKAVAAYESVKATVASIRGKLKVLLGDAEFAKILNRVLDKAHAKVVDAESHEDMLVLGRKLGLASSSACLPSRRSAQTPCSDYSIKSYAFTLGAGGGFVLGGQTSIGVVTDFKKHTRGIFSVGPVIGLATGGGGAFTFTISPGEVLDAGGWSIGGYVGGGATVGGGFGFDFGCSGGKCVGKPSLSFSLGAGVSIVPVDLEFTATYSTIFPRKK
jgi:hypothetical protein